MTNYYIKYRRSGSECTYQRNAEDCISFLEFFVAYAKKAQIDNIEVIKLWREQ
jgi:hypothetical protein